MKKIIFNLFILIFIFIKSLYSIEIIELTVWNMPSKWDKLKRKIWEEGIIKFQEYYPTIKIRGVDRFYKPQEFVSVMASGKGPDVVRIPITAIPIMAKYGFLAKLNKYTENWIQKDYMPDIMWSAVEIEGNIYGIPYDSYFTTLFYRKSIFKKAGIKRPPRDWNDIVLYSKIIKKKFNNKIWGIALVPDMFYFIDFIWQAGGDVFYNNKLSLDNNSIVKSLEYWYNLKWKYKITPPQRILYESDVEQLFSSGKIAMMIGVANKLPKMARRYGLNLSDVEIVPLPAGPTGIKAWHAGGDAFIINANIPEKNKDAAWKYIEYILSPPYQLWKWMRMKELKMIIFPGDFSCATNLINMPEFKNVKGLLNFAHVEPPIYNWPLIKEDFNKFVLEKIFINKNVDIKEILLNFDNYIMQEYKLNGR